LGELQTALLNFGEFQRASFQFGYYANSLNLHTIRNI